MFGQMPDFSNSFDMLRKMWEQSAMPAGLMPGMSGFGAPPVSLDDLEKRIQDLKAVESWLQLNANLLRSTIQGLEVQRATLVALQTFGATLSPEAVQATMARMAERPEAAPAAPKQAQEPTPEPTPEPAADASGSDKTGRADKMHDTAAASADAGQMADNAALWWNLLQQQFNQIASSAAAATMQPFGGLASMPEPPRRGKGTTKSATKPAPQSATEPTTKSAQKSTAKSTPKSAATPASPASSTKRAAKRPPA